VGPVQNERIFIPPRRKENFNFPYVYISLQAVCVGRPFIEITAEANCLKLAFIGEQNLHLIQCILYCLNIPDASDNKGE